MCEIFLLVKIRTKIFFTYVRDSEPKQTERRYKTRDGVGTLRVTWPATFRRRTDLERRSPRARVRGECTLGRPARRFSPLPCCGPKHHQMPLTYRSTTPWHHPLRRHRPPPTSRFHAPSRGEQVLATRHTFPIKYHRQVYWHQVVRTIAQM